ncbi:amino acid adenylation domain-containing protein [Paenibacillus sp. Marseille-P2973]|uniref:non-ribosomal peptide synthetase n=1 Tax=Paenibacillus sp. Marseille-P2973 TaxID=1871032 RepID=UPI001B39019D|nr:non-ribosomal peptide synthetase [Paenibacillus sp. Marseille-P2973]MBQ4899273.1 amino acid adenylation domain-containing protein [Paenibacillus sp. Marseille-P2973]
MNSLVELIRMRGDSVKGITFIRNGKEEAAITYGDLLQRSSALLKRMQDKGLQQGREIVFLLEDQELFLTWFWACQLGGMIPVPLSAGASEENKRKLIKVFQKLHAPLLVIEDKRVLERWEGEAESESEDQITFFRKLRDTTWQTGKEDLFEGPTGEIHHPDPNDLAFIQFSSGSTGDPKGVMLTHANLLANMQAIVACSEATDQDSSLSWMPLTHDMGLIGFHLTPLLADMQQYMMPTALFIQHPTMWFQKASDHRITTLASPNFGYSHFLNFYKKDRATGWDLSRIRLIFNGAEPISAKLSRQFTEEMSAYGLRSHTAFPVYGMAEASLAVTFPPVDEPLLDIRIERDTAVGEPVREIAGDDVGELSELSFVDLGMPVKYCQVRICDDDGNPLSERTIGEVQITGPNVTSGYYNDPVATGKAIGEDGWLRTGDLGFMRNGRLVVTGRKKDILFVNGQNVYPHDLERIIEEMDAGKLRRVAVCGAFNEQLQSDEIIVFAVYRGSIESFAPLADNVAKFIRERAGYEIGWVLPVKQLPKTTSGKLQRYILADQYKNGHFDQDKEALQQIRKSSEQLREAKWSEDETERALQRLCSEVLQTGPLDVNDSLLDIGINSLKVMMLVSAVSERFGVDLSIREVYSVPTIRELAKVVKMSRIEERGPIEKAAPRPYYPLTSAQNRIYMQEQLGGIGATYNIPASLSMNGSVDLNRVEQALQELVDRHESLRTSFHFVNGKAVQQIKNKSKFSLGRVQAEEQELSRIMERFVQPFEISEAPLFRAQAVRLGESSYVLLLDTHHLVCDGISLNVLIDEFRMLYQGNTLEAVPIQYKDYALWSLTERSGKRMERHRTYWMQRLEGPLPILEMITDHARPTERTFDGNQIKLPIPARTVQKLNKLAAARGATGYGILLSIYTVLLHRYTSQNDFVIGALTGGRIRPESNRVIGMFNNFLPIRQEVHAEQSFIDLLHQLNDTLLDAYDHQEMPFDEIVANCGIVQDRSRNPLFDTMLIYHNQMDGKVGFEANGVRFIQRDIPGRTSKLDLKWDIFPGADGQLDCVLEYNCNLFDRDTMNRFAERFIQLTEEAAEHPERPVGELEMMTPGEKGELVQCSAGETVEYRREATLHGLFEEQVRKDPDQVAWNLDSSALTYGELNERSNRLARHLRDCGIGPDVIAAVVMERSAEMMVALLAILKAGGAYLPISPDFPAERMSYMLEDSEARVVLTQGKLLSELRGELAAWNGVWVDVSAKIGPEESDSADRQADNDNLEPLGNSQNLAYVIYTSGSTGRPKGVMVEHRSVVNRLNWMQRAYPLCDQDVILQKTPFTFDVSVWELFWWGQVGAKVCFLAPGGEKYPAEIIEAVFRHGVTTMHFVPSMLNAFLDELETRPEGIGKLGSLRYVFASGEALTARQVNRFRALLGGSEGEEAGGVRLINLYGPTEATVDVSHYDCSGMMEVVDPVPIGKPIDNTRLYIVDSGNRLQPVGVAGELCIAGDGLARGYLNRNDLTVEKFIPCPFEAESGGVMYRTGDLARWLPDGNIEYLGRIDNQVKIRGYRIEPGEIEEAILRFEAVKEAVVTARKDTHGNAYLCAYYVTERDGLLEPSELRSELKTHLPGYMVPAFAVRLENLPLTVSGKIDRKALPEPQSQHTAEEGDYTAPTGETEEKLAEIWQEVLGVEKVSVHDHFFDLGGNSLTAAQLTMRIHRSFGRSLPLRDLFRTPTIAGLASQLELLESTGDYSEVVPAELRDAYPLTPAQKRLFFLSRMEDQSRAYNLPVVIEITGSVDAGRLEEAFMKLIERHSSLRTAFVLKDGVPVQMIRENVGFELFTADIGNKSLQEWYQRFVTPFDLANPPLLRAALINETDEKRYLLFDMHHIAGDGLSMVVLQNEVIALYEGKPLAEQTVQYKDFALWQLGEANQRMLEKQRLYWLDAMAGERPVLDLPMDYARPSLKSNEGGQHTFIIPERLASKLNALASQAGATPYMVLLSVFHILLARSSGQTEIMIGTPVAGRPQASLESMIGMFVNTLVIRNRMNNGQSFKSFLESVRTTALGAFDNSDYPFEELVDELGIARDLSRNPLFDVMFVMQNMQRAKPQIGEVTFHSLDIPTGVSKFDLLLEIMTDEMDAYAYKCKFEYSTKLFKAATIARFAERFIQLANEAAEHPERPVGELEMMSSGEKEQLVQCSAGETVEYRREATLHGLFEEQVRKDPDQVAWNMDSSALTYGELNERSNRLARHLRECGLGPDVIAAVVMERSAEMMVALLAVLKAGGAYLPISPDFPAERMSYMLEDSKARFVLTQEKLLGELRGKLASWNGEWVDVSAKIGPEESGSADRQANNDNLEPLGNSQNLAYVIYTSGSTGRPKGVMVEHRSVVNRLNWMQRAYPLSDRDVILQKTPFTFDVSVWELFWWGQAGAKVCFLTPGGEKDPAEIIEAVSRHGVTTMHFVPSMLNAFLDELETRPEGIGKLGSLRYVLASGDALTARQVNRFRALLGGSEGEEAGGARLINLYGPTEATVDVSHYDCSGLMEVVDPVPIGKPIDNTRLYIVDVGNRLQPVGVAGELCIAGDGLARGYLNRNDLTAEKFIPCPFEVESGGVMYRTGDLARWLPDGNIEYLGRIDNQVKIRGYRIEPGEIEEAILRHEAVKEAVVTARKDTHGNAYLCAYYVTERDGKLEPSELRSELKAHLPVYMVPAFAVRLEELPLTVSGKIDRKALPEPQLQHTAKEGDYTAPSGQMEEKLAAIWQEVLGVEKVSVHDNFFDVGGNSLLLLRMQHELDRMAPGAVKITDLFAHPTVTKLAAFIEERQRDGNRPWPVQPAVLPVSFFTVSGQNQQATVLESRLDSETTQRLNTFAQAYNTDLYAVLVTSYLFVLGKHAHAKEMTVQAALPGQTLVNVGQQFEGITDFSELLDSVSQGMSNAGNSLIYTADEMRQRGVKKDDHEAYPLVRWKKDGQWGSRELHWFDFVLSAQQDARGVEFSLDYNGRRMRREKMKALLSDLMKFLVYLSEQSMQKEGAV